MTQSSCPRCNYTYSITQNGRSCPLCTGKWEKWDLQFSPLPLPEIKEQIAAWLGQLPSPAAIEIGASRNGLRVRLYTPPGKGQGTTRAWAALTQQQSRWKQIPILKEGSEQVSEGGRYSSQHPPWGVKRRGWYGYALHTTALLPKLAAADGDTLLAIGGQLLSLLDDDREGERKPKTAEGESARRYPSSVPHEGEVLLQIWFLGKRTKLQERLRALAAYHYGTESGVDNDTPNPWGLRLGLWRVGLYFGGMIAAISGGVLAAGWISVFVGLLGILAGGLLFIAALLGTLSWMKWRSIPKDTLERSINGPLLQVGFVLRLNTDSGPPENGHSLPELLAGEAEWGLIKSIKSRGERVEPCQESGVSVVKDHLAPRIIDTLEWPAIQGFAMPLPAEDLAGLIAPPEAGEGSGLVDREFRQDVPAPPPSRALVEAPFKIGMAVATGESIGIDPDGHGLATGGSRTGKSSFVFRLLKQFIERGDEAPGILLVDPHASLADGFLHIIDQLPEDLRAKAIQRLRIITPDQPEVVPLNLLAIPEFSWAGNAIIQAGRRIWDDYWGPRMQAALLGLFRLAHAWNLKHPDRCMGLLHVVFAAFNTELATQCDGLFGPGRPHWVAGTGCTPRPAFQRI